MPSELVQAQSILNHPSCSHVGNNPPTPAPFLWPSASQVMLKVGSFCLQASSWRTATQWLASLPTSLCSKAGATLAASLVV